MLTTNHLHVILMSHRTRVALPTAFKLITNHSNDAHPRIYFKLLTRPNTETKSTALFTSHPPSQRLLPLCTLDKERQTMKVSAVPPHATTASFPFFQELLRMNTNTCKLYRHYYLYLYLRFRSCTSAPNEPLKDETAAEDSATAKLLLQWISKRHPSTVASGTVLVLVHSTLHGIIEVISARHTLCLTTRRY
ncbi:uncharacterized protein YALI1_F35191g [Yarrowia lipolytica]|uniref:Uncharacterized protein n=1 Tax=Yarrowia lipolytica TaxID=4952 RepID=A0A1D8NQ83_YARLL|nr:hypothetical protein YALI1_F35191g [Yarrowia lipolytica]